MTRSEYNPDGLPENLRIRVKVLPNGCWDGRGRRKLNPSGYSYVWYQGTDRPVHIVAYLVLVGQIPEGLELDHLCRNRWCCNPEHLEAVTHEENVRRGLHGDLQTHCRHGHPWTEENIGITKAKGKRQRYCRICNRYYGRRYRARLKAELLERAQTAPDVRQMETGARLQE